MLWQGWGCPARSWPRGFNSHHGNSDLHQVHLTSICDTNAWGKRERMSEQKQRRRFHFNREATVPKHPKHSGVQSWGRQELLNAITWGHFTKAQNYWKEYHLHFAGEEMSWESWQSPRPPILTTLFSALPLSSWVPSTPSFPIEKLTQLGNPVKRIQLQGESMCSMRGLRWSSGTVSDRHSLVELSPWCRRTPAGKEHQSQQSGCRHPRSPLQKWDAVIPSRWHLFQYFLSATKSYCHYNITSWWAYYNFLDYILSDISYILGLLLPGTLIS